MIETIGRLAVVVASGVFLIGVLTVITGGVFIRGRSQYGIAFVFWSVVVIAGIIHATFLR